jgi:hypothetical protein
VAEHSELVGSNILNGFAKGEERIKRIDDYFKNGIVPTTPYVITQEKEEIEVKWDQEGLNAFRSACPKAFQKFVKKAIEKKANDKGIEIITKEVFWQIKKESGN